MERHLAIRLKFWLRSGSGLARWFEDKMWIVWGGQMFTCNGRNFHNSTAAIPSANDCKGCHFMHPFSDIQYRLVLILYRCHAYLSSTPLMCCILSECMLVGRNSAKLNLVGRGLKSKFGVNHFFSWVSLHVHHEIRQGLVWCSAADAIGQFTT